MVLNPPSHRKALGTVIAQVLTPSKLDRARELSGAPQSEALMRWLRDNMPSAAQQVEDILYPAD
jgi:hypothetical protein